MRARSLTGLFFGIMLMAGTAAAQPYMAIFDVNAENRVYHFFIDESANETANLDVKFYPNAANVTQVELYTTLNRRNQATLSPASADSVVAGDTNGYWGAYTMNSIGGGGYQVILPVSKCGSYDITARYKTSGNANWQWYQGRLPVANVSDVATRDMVVYEMQANVVDATGDDNAHRSTFADLHDGTRFNIQYLNDLGVNCIWLQPFHPIGAKSDCNTGELGSPYSIKNLFQVAPHLGSDNTREDAMNEFTNFVIAAKNGGVKVIFDVIFNHVATDIEIERNPDNPSVLNANPLQEMRNIKPQWFSKYLGVRSGCPTTKPQSDWGNYKYTEPADSSSQIGPAPADRNDFVWPDAFDLFWGTYPALGNIGDTSDGAWVASAEVKKMTEYYAYFIKYWIEKTGGSVGGFRCDFAQGLPRQAWQYLINVAKSVNPELYFVSESLDGGNIAYRAWKGGFDALNENELWAIVENNNIQTTDLRSIIDARKTQFGLALILRGTMNHDQGPWIGRKWDGVAMHSVFCALDGSPQMYFGQELGYDTAVGQFSKTRTEFGRVIPNIREYHNIENLWNNRNNFGNDALWYRYAEANKGRARATVLRTANQYYLDQVNNNGPHQKIFSVLKYENFGWDPSDQEVVLAFVNLAPQQAQAGTFNINVPAIYLNPTKTYNVKNLSSSTPNTYVWAQGRTGADLAANGIYVGFSGNVYNEGAIAQYLKLEEVGANNGGSTNLVWIGNTSTYPTQGNIDAGEDLWIDIESYPQGAGEFGSVVYSSDGVNWSTKNLATNGTVGSNDKWHANLGGFPAAATVRFAVTLTDKGGNQLWDSNNSSNYIRTVNTGGNGSPVQWIGNTRHWPTNGAITSADDIWIDIESWPVGTAAGGMVVYSSNNGSTWEAAPLTSNGQTPGPNINDWWHVNLGHFPGGASVQYAVMIEDSNGAETWANNGGSNFVAIVNAGGGGGGGGIIWVGNTVHRPVVTPEVGEVTPMVSGRMVHFGDLKNGGSYIVFRGTNLLDSVNGWTAAHSFTGSGSTLDWLDGSSNGIAYYALGGYNWPTGGSVYVGDEIVINFETYPTGAAQQVSIVYSINGLQWTNRPMSWAGKSGNNDLWTINLGTFPLGVQLQYAIEAVDANTNALWDNNGTANFTIPIKDPNAPDDEAPVLTHSPQNTTTANATLDVSLSATDNEDPNPAIYYTTNGDNPTTNSALYGGVAIHVTDAGSGVDKTIKAIARDATGNQSAIHVVEVRVNENQQTGPSKPYSTNPSFGKRVANGAITIDGANTGGEWSTNNLIALDMANDDPRSLGSNWTMHEAPIDLTHVWAAWDDNNLYLAWQYVDVTDVLDPANAGGAGSGKISSNDGILQWIVIDTIAGQGATNDVWGKFNTWAGANKPNYQIYLAGSLWQGYISRAVNGTFALDDGGVNYKTIAAAGVTAAKGSTYAGGAALWGVGDADNRFDGGAPNRNFMSEGHAASRDSFYEIKIPLSYLQITATDLEANGAGVMIGGGSASAMDCIPNDPATLDTPGVEAWNSSLEWGDKDVYTSPFARIAK